MRYLKYRLELLTPVQWTGIIIALIGFLMIAVASTVRADQPIIPDKISLLEIFNEKEIFRIDEKGRITGIDGREIGRLNAEELTLMYQVLFADLHPKIKEIYQGYVEPMKLEPQ